MSIRYFFTTQRMKPSLIKQVGRCNLSGDFQGRPSDGNSLHPKVSLCNEVYELIGMIGNAFDFLTLSFKLGTNAQLAGTLFLIRYPKNRMSPLFAMTRKPYFTFSPLDLGRKLYSKNIHRIISQWTIRSTISPTN